MDAPQAWQPCHSAQQQSIQIKDCNRIQLCQVLQQELKGQQLVPLDREAAQGGG